MPLREEIRITIEPDLERVKGELRRDLVKLEF